MHGSNKSSVAMLGTFQVTNAQYDLVRGTWPMVGVPLTSSIGVGRLTSTNVDTEA